MLKNRFAAIAAMIGLVFATLVSGSAPASAATDDATLSGLNLWSGSWRADSGLQPGFSSDRTWYQFSTSTQDFYVSATTNDPGSTIHLQYGSHDDVVNSGDTTTLTMPVQVTKLTVHVVAADGTTTKDYKVMLNVQTMMQPELVSQSMNTGGDLGGERLTVRVRNLVTNSYTNQVSCWEDFSIQLPDGSSSSGMEYNIGATDNDGITTVYLYMEHIYSDDWYTGKADLSIRNMCQTFDYSVGWWKNQSATAVFKDFWEYKPVQLDTSVKAPNTLTEYQRFTMKGFGINGSSDIWGFIYDPAFPDEWIYVWKDGFIDNTTIPLYVDNMPRTWEWNWAPIEHWNKPGKKTLYLFKCGTNYDGPRGCWKRWDGDSPTPLEDLVKQGNVLYQGDVNYQPLTPANVTVSPNKGGVAGGNKIRIRGQNLENIYFDGDNGGTTVKIGGQAITDLRAVQWGNAWDPTNNYMVVEGTVPAATQAGSVPITITNTFNETTISTKYVYSAKPVIDSIAPSTVSNSGGSLITLTGKNFGTVGTPTVTINGNKSPCVTRVNDTKVIAMVPADTATGAVDVNMISGAGGGSPDLPSSITLAAPSASGTVTKVTPSTVSIAGGDTVVVTGTGFSAAGTVGVMVGANCAKVTASTATSITFEVPSGDAAGTADLIIGSTTGTITKVGAITYSPTPGVTSVVPSALAPYATGADANIVINGNGFGTSGTIKVGSGAAVNYTATDGGTKISGVAVPTSAAGSLAIVITPKGATVPLTSSVKVRAPQVTYVGTNPYDDRFKKGLGWWNWGGGYVLQGPASGGTQALIQGTDFGSVSGTVKFGTVTASVVSWSDTEIVVTLPALAAGTYDVSIAPATGTLVATAAQSYISSVSLPGSLNILKVAADVDNGRTNAAHTFDPTADISDVFTMTGVGLAGSDNGASTKLIIGWDWNSPVTVTPYSVTNTSLKFHAPRTFNPVDWQPIKVITNLGSYQVEKGLLYVGNVPQPVTFGPGYTLCANNRTDSWDPGSFGTNGPAGTYGSSGTVTIGGVAIPAAAVTWSDTSVSVNFASIPGSWTTLWGSQTVIFTPSDTTLPSRSFGMSCGVDTTVTTLLNGSTSDLTIAAGTAYTATVALTRSLTGVTYTNPADGYQYVNASDYNNYGFNRNVYSGLPIAAGDYYVRTSLWNATYDNSKYIWVGYDNAAVHLTITGTAVTFTPKLSSGSGNTITYNGPLGDGTNGSTNDITYDKTATNDAITAIYYEYRDHQCQGDQYGWNWGLPQGVAIAPQYCGGDGSSVSSWDIRVRAFDMIVNGVNRNIYYIPTYNVFNLTINKKGVTISKVTATKSYDGTPNISFGEMTVTGAVNNETPTLDGNLSSGTFADSNVGTNKPITLGGDLVLSWGYRNNYTLLNPNIVLTGTITKADAQLRLTSSVPSVIMTNPAPFEVTATVRDMRNWQTPDPASGISPVVITVGSGGVCSINGTTVTPIKAGDCVINATQAASANYNASKSFQDDSLTTETITVKIFAQPKAVQIVADDVTIAQGESLNPTAQAIGLLDGDGLNSVNYDIYQGTTLLTDVPTEPGTYKIVPKDASLQAADMAAYQPDFKYVSGKLIITQVPPVFTDMAPNHGPEAGGATATITGTNLGDVTSISWGSTTIRKPNFVVNGDGTEITLTIPAGTGQIDVILNAGLAQVPTTYVYDAPVVTPVTAPVTLSLKLQLEVGAKLSGQDVTISGGGLKANSEYTLELHSTTVIIYQGTTDANGSFLQKVVLPAQACVEAAQHSFKLTGIKPDGTTTSDTAYFTLGDKCVVGQGQAVKTVVKDKTTWTLSGFLFKYKDEHLVSTGKTSLNALLKLIKSAKVVKIYGYTETDTKDPKIKKANLILAKARCVEVQKYLASKGLKAKFVLYGKGGVNPVSLTDQSLNRRVVIEATY